MGLLLRCCSGQRASSCDDEGSTWIFSSFGGILELRRGIQASSCVGPGSLIFHSSCQGLLDEPGMYFNFRGFVDQSDRIKVYNAKIGTSLHNAEPGEIVSVSKKYFTMACGNGTTLDIYEVQPVGKKRMSATDFINGGLKKYRG